MSTVKLRSGRVIGDYLAPYFIAELNTSHFGDIGIARSMIDQAKEAGCDCVKFQSWSSESLYADSYYKQNAITKRIVTKFSLDNSELKQLADYCSEVGIDFASTPYSRAEADFLARDCNVPFIKIASMELNNLPYLAYLATLDVPLVLSTGMGTLDEIITAVCTIETAGNTDIIILHCTSVYPAPPEAIRLNNILGLRAEFPAYPIGYSDHSMGSEIPAASIALGACVVEKHFTLDSSRIGMDNQMATEPEDMKRMIDACNTVHRALGGAGRILDETERAQIPKMRRSIVTAKALPAGHMLTSYDLDAKRPGTGLAPDKVDLLIGKRLKKSVDQGDVLSVDDVE